MATAIANVNTNQNDTGAVSTEKATVRLYVKMGTQTDKDNNTINVIEKQQVSTASSEITEVKDKETGAVTRMPANWAKLEADGFVAFNENEVVRYYLKSMDGLAVIAPDPAQQLLIINTGLSSLQSAKTTQIAKALKEDTTDPEPLFNGETIDLRVGVDEDGSYGFNAKPKRTSLTDDEKLLRVLIATGKSEAEAQKIVAYINSTKQMAEQTA